ncbi:MAG TPA: hypothetical protein VIK27_11725 [Candidatus Aquilonibacter sp.]
MTFLGPRLDRAGSGGANGHDRGIRRSAEFDQQTRGDHAGPTEAGAAVKQHATTVA